MSTIYCKDKRMILNKYKLGKRRIEKTQKQKTSHEIPILRTIRYINKNLIQYLGISSLLS